MNILFVSSLFPFPTDKGAKIRLLQLMRALSPRHKVSLFAFRSRDASSNPSLVSAPEDITMYPVSASRLERLISLTKAVGSSKPLQVLYCESRDARRKLRQVTRDNRFDFVIFHLLRMAEYAKEIKSPRVVLDIGDAVSQYLKRSMEFRRSFWERGLLGIEQRRVEKYERQRIPDFLCTLVSSEVDKAVLGRMCPVDSMEVIPNAVDVQHLVPSNTDVFKVQIVFVGNFSYYPNVDAVLTFCRDVLPLVWKERPDLVFYAVGASPPKSVRALARDPRIVVTGTVPDIRAHLKLGSVFVCPVRFGGGTKFKVLEAMAMGLPVVSTPVGSEGIDVSDGEELFVARNAQDFAQRVLQLATDQYLNRKMGSAARRTMELKYDQRIVAKRLESLLVQLRGVDR